MHDVSCSPSETGREREGETEKGRCSTEGETRVTKPRLVRGEARRGEARQGEERRGEERREEERRREERRVEPVGRALCTSGRSFPISPPPIPRSPSRLLSSTPVPSFSIPLSLFSSSSSSLALSPSRLFRRLSPSLFRCLFSLRLCSFRLSSPFCHSPRTPSTFRYHLGVRLGLK